MLDEPGCGCGEASQCPHFPVWLTSESARPHAQTRAEGPSSDPLERLDAELVNAWFENHELVKLVPAERSAASGGREAPAPSPLLSFDGVGGEAARLAVALEWQFPGQGQPYENCGVEMVLGHARALRDRVEGESLSAYRSDGVEGHFVRAPRRCNRASCPRCYESWAALEAVEIALRVGDGLPRVGRKNAIHVVASPPQAMALEAMGTLRGFRKLRRKAQAIFKGAGVVGGCLIFHHKRVPSRWNERSLCVNGPHFHAIGAGWIDGTARLNAKTGWVVVNLGVRKSVYATALYILSHAGLAFRAGYAPSAKSEGGRMAVNTVVWFGEWSYQKFPRAPREDEAGRYCPVCERYVPLDEWMKLDPGPPDGKGAKFGVLPWAEFERASMAGEAERPERVWG